ncbi:40S ribosomal protein S21 [Anaeramoeba ignava]|uniref:40S ribosomal protein S21 n=1 Tax=Anaeramoeba ignava TaxID=1746090 RepID=A0A9Q0LRD0_ANAIG|nr:40S ribosomal protein S21 [Anaeramoeba ignava]
MQNDEGKLVDKYIPRKCSATNRVITPKDHAAIQISIPDVGKQGKIKPGETTFVICGFLRDRGESDAAMNRLAKENGFLKL